jgi:hypothetical protein
MNGFDHPLILEGSLFEKPARRAVIAGKVE